MAERRPTIADVARRVGVSKTLVSFVFNNRPGVAPETRERILATAKEMGWRPRPSARSLSIRRSFALGLVLRRDASVLTADSFFPAFIAGVETVLADEGQVLVLSVVPEATELGTYRTLASDHRVDGVFLTDLRRDDTRLPLLVELGLPAVTLGRPDSASDFPCVDLDDRPGVEQTVEHLRALGHARIAYVAGDAAMLHGQRRRACFVAAMAAAGLSAPQVEDTDFSATEAALATDRLLQLSPRPTAIVYASDPMAVAGLGIIQARGLRCPDDISVAGFDGADIARHIYPALTTVVSDPVAWGRSAARTLLQLIADGRADDVQLPAAQLRIAQSTAPLTELGARPIHPYSAIRHPLNLNKENTVHRRTLKALALTTTLAVTLSLAACGGDDDSGSGTDATSAKGPITIWYSNNEQEVAWGKAMVESWNAAHADQLIEGQEIPAGKSSEEVIGAAITAGHRTLPGLQHRSFGRGPVPAPRWPGQPGELP